VREMITATAILDCPCARPAFRQCRSGWRDGAPQGASQKYTTCTVHKDVNRCALIKGSRMSAVDERAADTGCRRPKACGRCGCSMYVRYNLNRHHRRPRYVCIDQTDARRAACQSVLARDIDAATAQLVLDLMTPTSIEMTLAIQSEVDRRMAESEQDRSSALRERYGAAALSDGRSSEPFGGR